MSANLSDTLQVLRYELNYLELGGIERDRGLDSIMSPFQETSACLNFDSPLRAHACSECALFQFVPEDKRAEELPCHHVPLNSSGETIAELLTTDRRRMIVLLEQWLRTTIAQLEATPNANNVNAGQK